MVEPAAGVYAAIFIDAIMVKIRDGQVGNAPVYAAIGVDLEGRKDILGMWAGDGGGKSAKFWLAVLTELKNRGVTDTFFVVCDGAEGPARRSQRGVAACHRASPRRWPEREAMMREPPSVNRILVLNRKMPRVGTAGVRPALICAVTGNSRPRS